MLSFQGIGPNWTQCPYVVVVVNRYRHHRSSQNGCSVLDRRCIQPASMDRFCQFIKGGKLYYSTRPCPGFCTVVLFPLSKLGPWAAREQPLTAMKWIYQYTHIYLPIITGNLHCVSQLPPPSVEEEPSFNTSILAILRITCGSKKWLVWMLQTSQQVRIVTWYQLSSICKCHQLSNCQPTNFEF